MIVVLYVLLSVKEIRNNQLAVRVLLVEMVVLVVTGTVRENVIGHVAEGVTLHVMTNAIRSAPMLAKQHVRDACQSVKVDVPILVIIIVITKLRHKSPYY